jgi:O-antigen ligase
LILRPRIGRLLTILGVGSMLVLAMAALDVRFTPPGAPRELSLDILSRSLMSVVTESERTDLENTKGWRLNWWRRIWEYTANGPYFWTGKGYGINLADSDGFQVGTRDEPLRSPHNSHLTFLARSGVPGFLLWLLVQGTWAFLMARSYVRARTFGGLWPGIFAWLLAYWLAFMIEAGFDVSLEGPMTGIPFWTIFGLGWGCQMEFNRRITMATRMVVAESPEQLGVSGSLNALPERS